MTFEEKMQLAINGKNKQEQLDILEGWRIYIEVSTDWLSDADNKKLDTLYQMMKKIEVSL
jgi:hypothetical protein